MKPGYQAAWALILTCAAGTLFWTLGGRAWYRRRVIGLRMPAERDRAARHFVAVEIPRLSPWDEPFTMRPGEFEKLVRGLSAEGYSSIGLSDVEDFYRRGRPLPEKAVLLALDRDDPTSVAYADETLARYRMKGVCFLNKTRYGAGTIRRHSLTAHAVAEMKRSGAWEFGWFSDDKMRTPAGLEAAPVLDASDTSSWMRDCAKHPFRFEGQRQGYNGPEQSLCAVKIMHARSDWPAQSNLRAIDSNWPRRQPFFDDFRAERLGPDWIPGWGVISATRNRLAVIPTPRQTSASVFLNGTDEWSDQVVEMTVKEYRKSLWLYLRFKEGRRFVRVGAKDGLWKVEQKPGPKEPLRTLASAPIDALPARLSVVLKNQSLLVHVNDRAVFRHSVDLDPRVDKGRVAVAVYDAKAMAALGIITSFRAAPLRERWLALDGLSADLGQAQAIRLHDAAVLSRGVSPRWLTIAPDGTLEETPRQLELLRSLSGFNRCLVAPALAFKDGRFALPEEPAAVEKLVAAVTRAAERLSADGVNLQVPETADARAAQRFAGLLRDALHARRRRLWVTLDGRARPDGRWTATADAVLRPSHRALDRNAQVLEIYDMEAAK